MFIVFRYKKLRAALAMERTKPIKPNKKQKNVSYIPSSVTETTLGLKPLPRLSLTEITYKESLNVKVHLPLRSLTEKSEIKDTKHKRFSQKKTHNSLYEKLILVLGGWGRGRGWEYSGVMSGGKPVFVSVM